MKRVVRGHAVIWLAIAAIALVAFIAVKLVRTHHGPALVIRSEGREARLARGVLASELEKMFRGSNGRWRVIAGETPPCGSRPSTTGRAVTATYLFADWLELRLADGVYADAASARKELTRFGARRVEACRALFVADSLRHEGYTAVEPHGFSSGPAPLGEGATSSHIEVRGRYKGRTYNWHLDSTAVLRGRMLVVAATVVAGRFAEPNRALAADLATIAGSSTSAR